MLLVLDLTGKGSVYRNKNQDIKCSLTVDENDLLKALEDKSHWRTVYRLFESKTIRLN
jgi:hypothetical protein